MSFNTDQCGRLIFLSEFYTPGLSAGGFFGRCYLDFFSEVCYNGSIREVRFLTFSGFFYGNKV